jgi:DnaK suppressor protein
VESGRLLALRAQREALLDQLAALTRDHDGIVRAAEMSNVDDEHDPEGATIAFERQQLATLLDRTRTRLGDVDRGPGAHA